MTSIRENIVGIELRDRVRSRVVDGTRIVGSCAAVRRDQAGIRVVLCPVDAARRPRRIRLPRTPSGWQRPYLERWDEADERWEREAEIVDLRSMG